MNPHFVVLLQGVMGVLLRYKKTPPKKDMTTTTKKTPTPTHV